ncbi:DUF6030 family protein [Hoeflea ulvae]|uniref:DUF6030 family protein n=1 Tax=Hoeflea ulvae TaxID=2983764 RepID=A0ABT3YKF0_9HYPH|nr:DUF6030 family protein [Hoeflea ulvae]MCY0096373.1 DUF6030 family protein [Hoeflea ulvae]
MTRTPRRGKALFLVAVLVIAGGLASVVLLANNSRNLDLLLARFGVSSAATVPPLPPLVDEPAPETVQSAKPPEPVIYMPERMMDPPVTAPQNGFRRTISRGRDDVCGALQKQGWVSQDWQAAEPGDRPWSCGAEKVVPDADDPALVAGSLFVSARGTGSDSVSSVRLKVNFLDGGISDLVAGQAVAAAVDILDAIGWGDQPAVLEKLRRFEPFAIEGNGNTMSLSREPTDIPRFNFLIVSDPSGITGENDASDARRKWLEVPGTAN